MRRVLIIGIDALDSAILTKFGDDLPCFKALMKMSPDLTLASVYPPDSDTAWASIYTGSNPAAHGIVYFVNPLEKSRIISSTQINNSVLHGNTFWDIAGNVGKKVCILLPHLGYPAWDVNGIMVARSTISKDVQASPKLVSTEHKLSLLAGMRGFPGRGKSIARYIEAHKKLLRNEAEFSLEMMRNRDWDLLFTYSSSLDYIQHFFWNYCDENDPTFPGENPFQNVIRDFYKLYDELVGEYINAAGSDTTIIVQSDHGHGMRPVKLVNINEYLREKGLLYPKANNLGTRGAIRLMERLKIWLADVIAKYGLGAVAQKLMSSFPWTRKIYTSPLSIDWHRTVACVTDLSGIKAYSYGGVRIIKENIKGIGYEELRQQLVEDLSKIEEPDEHKRLMKWICTREELYSGEHITKYPDIVFQLEDNYGAGWDIDAPLIGTSHSHKFVPGSHKGDTGVFLIIKFNGRQINTDHLTLMDIAPTVLDLLDVKVDRSFDGQSIFNSSEERL